MSSSTGVKKNAFQGWGQANTQANQLGANAANIYGSLQPEIASEAAHPAGYSPQQKSAITTAGQQSAGGSMAGATGQGALLAARTRNAGAAQNAIQQAGRQSSKNLSDVATGVETGSADLAAKRQADALRAEQGLYGTELGGSQKAMGLSNEFLDTLNRARPSWWQNMATIAGEPVAKGLGTAVSGALFG